MAKIPDYLNTTNGWAQIVVAVASHAADLPYLEEPSHRLASLQETTNSLNAEYRSLTAAKQEVGQKLQQALREGDTLAAFLRAGARERFGSRSEKLVQFGLQPFRGRARKVAPPPSEKPDPETVPSPAPELK